MTVTSRAAVHLHARPSGFLSADRIVEDVRNGRTLTHLVHRWTGRSGHFELAGKSYDIRQMSLFAPCYELSAGGEVLATAQRPSLFSRELEVLASHCTWRLDKPFFSRVYEIHRGGRVVGSIAPTSWFSRDTELVGTEEMQPELAIFLLWLTHALQRRANAQ